MLKTGTYGLVRVKNHYHVIGERCWHKGRKKSPTKSVKKSRSVGIVLVSWALLAFLSLGITQVYALTSDEKWGYEQTQKERVAIQEQTALEKRIALIDKIDKYAEKHGVSKELVHFVIKNESHYNEYAVGDLYIFVNGKPVYSRGLLQISQQYHPEISNECAFNADCALDRMLPLMKSKKECMRQWTMCRVYYR